MRFYRGRTVERATLAEFRPKVKPGRIEVLKDAQYYVLEGSNKKIKIPRTFADFFTIAQGETDIQQLFALFYEKHQYVPFRGFLNFIFDMAKQDVLENSAELKKFQNKRTRIDFIKNIVLVIAFFEILMMVVDPQLRSVMIAPLALTLSTYFLLESWSASYLPLFVAFPLIFCLNSNTLIWGFSWTVLHAGLWMLKRKMVKPKANTYAVSFHDTIANLPVFESLSNSELNSVLTKAKNIYLPAGSFVTKKGELAQSIYVLLEGQAEVIVGTEQVKLTGPCVFGESALKEESIRQADIKTITPVQLLQINASLFPKGLNSETSELEIAAKQFFKTSPVFSYFGPSVANEFLMYGRLLYLGAEQIIFEEKSEGDCLYLLIRGSVDIQMQGQTLKSLKQGDLFGEISLMAHIPRTATVKTKENTLLLEIPNAAFWEILTQNLDLALLIESIGAKRFDEAQEFKENLKAAG